jgi:acyl-CoA thioesterase I
MPTLFRPVFTKRALLFLSLGMSLVACNNASNTTGSHQNGGAGGDLENSGGSGGAAGGSHGGSVGSGGAAGGSGGSIDGGVPPAKIDAAADAMVAAPSPYLSCILPVGDSITQGDLQHLSYRYWLWKSLTDGGHKFGFVGSMRNRELRDPKLAALPYPDSKFDIDHEGHWGKKPSEILTLMQAVANWDKQTPGIVLLHAGTNEVWTAGTETAAAISTRAIADLGKVIDFLRTKNPKVLIFVAKIIPLNTLKYAGGIADSIDAINQKISAMVDAKTTVDSPVAVVDQANGFTDDDFLPDGIHPNEVGEKKLAAKWLKSIEPVLQKFGPLPCPL